MLLWVSNIEEETYALCQEPSVHAFRVLISV
jgi:hypothetical protein